MSMLQDQAVQMINGLSDENVRILIDFMQRFKPSNNRVSDTIQPGDEPDFMQEMETMRIQAKAYFPADFDPQKVWEEAIDEKYGDFD